MARPKDLDVQIMLPFPLILVLVGHQIGLDLGKFLEQVVARVEVAGWWVGLVGGIALPLQVRLDGINQIDGGLLAQWDGVEALVGE